MVGSVGVVDVDLDGRSPDVSDLLALDQADDKEDQKCDKKGTCLYQITVRRASFSTRDGRSFFQRGGAGRG